MGRRLASERARGDLGQQRGGLLSTPLGAVLDQVQRRRRSRAVALPQPAAELGAVLALRANQAAAAVTPLRSATRSTMSDMILLSSKSFGV